MMHFLADLLSLAELSAETTEVETNEVSETTEIKAEIKAARAVKAAGDSVVPEKEITIVVDVIRILSLYHFQQHGNSWHFLNCICVIYLIIA